VESGNAPEIRPAGILRQMTAAVTHYVSWGRLEWLRAASGIRFLVVAGAQDNLVNSQNAYLLACALDAPLLLREDAGHGVTDSYATDVNMALQRHVEEAQAAVGVEGRRPVRAIDAVPAGWHPWKVGVAVLVAWRLLVGRRERRWAGALVFAAAVLRALYGPLWRSERRVRVLL